MANMAVNALRLTDTLQREQQGRSALFSILALAKQQQSLAGRKTILFFSQGVQAPPTLEHVLLTAISEANRANVSVYAVDARGLSTVSDSAVARETLEQASATSMRQQQLRGFRLFTREEMLISDTAEASLRMDTIATLGQLAESTGGMLISHTNDVRAGIARAVGDLRGYYEIAYSPWTRAFDGKFRKITLKVSRPGVATRRAAATSPCPRARAPPPSLRGPAARGHALGGAPARPPDPRPRFPLRAGAGAASATPSSWSSRSTASSSRATGTRPSSGPTSRSWASCEPPGARWPRSSARTRRSGSRAAARGAHAGERRLHALVHRARGPLPPRDGGSRPAVGAHDRRAEPPERPPGPRAGGPQQPRGGQACRAGAERCSRLRRPVPGGRGPHRALGQRGGGGHGPAGGPLLRRLRPAGLQETPQVAPSSSGATAGSWPVPSRPCRHPTATAASRTS